MSRYINILDKYFKDEAQVRNELEIIQAKIIERTQTAYNNAWITKEAIRKAVSYDQICIEISDELSVLREYRKAFKEFLEMKSIISCKSCNQKIRIKKFDIEAIFKCPNCSIKLRLRILSNGQIEVTLLQESKRDKNHKDKNHKSSHATQSQDNCYEILGVEEGASFEEIKRAYKNRITKYHPDKVSHLGEEFKVLAENKTKEINNALSELEKIYN